MCFYDQLTQTLISSDALEAVCSLLTGREALSDQNNLEDVLGAF